MRGARMLLRGERPATVARILGVSRQSVMRWQRALERGGIESISRIGRRGARPQLSRPQLKELALLLSNGARAEGHSTDAWTLRRVSALIRDRFQVSMSISSVCRMLKSIDWGGHHRRAYARRARVRQISPDRQDRGRLMSED